MLQLSLGIAYKLKLTVIHDVLIPVECMGAIVRVYFCYVDGPDDTLLPQISHEELQTNEGKDTEAENGEDHHIWQLLHRLDQSANNGLQTWDIEYAHTYTHTNTQKSTDSCMCVQVPEVYKRSLKAWCEELAFLDVRSSTFHVCLVYISCRSVVLNWWCAGIFWLQETPQLLCNTFLYLYLYFIKTHTFCCWYHRSGIQ